MTFMKRVDERVYRSEVLNGQLMLRPIVVTQFVIVIVVGLSEFIERPLTAKRTGSTTYSR